MEDDYLDNNDFDWSRTIKFDTRYENSSKYVHKYSKNNIIGYFGFFFSTFMIALFLGITFSKVPDNTALKVIVAFYSVFLMAAIALIVISKKRVTNGFKGVVRMTFSKSGFSSYKLRVVSTKRNNHYEYEDKIKLIEIRNQCAKIIADKGKCFYIPLNAISSSDTDYLKKIAESISGIK